MSRWGFMTWRCTLGLDSHLMTCGVEGFPTFHGTKVCLPSSYSWNTVKAGQTAKFNIIVYHTLLHYNLFQIFQAHSSCQTAGRPLFSLILREAACLQNDLDESRHSWQRWMQGLRRTPLICGISATVALGSLCRIDGLGIVNELALYLIAFVMRYST